MAFIEIVAPAQAEGKLKEVYESIAKSRGSIAEVHQVASLHPELMQAHHDFYMTLIYGRGGLSRLQRELVATSVSRANGCEYCTVHHSEAYARYEKDTEKVRAVAANPESAPLADDERALVAYALKLTRTPSAVTRSDVDALRAAGLSDRDVLAAAAVTGYFNFVNRLVLGCGVDLEAQEEREYRY